MRFYLLDLIIGRPISVVLIIFLVIIWFLLNQYLIPIESVSFNYEKVFVEKEYWRCFTSALSHYGILHLVFNMSSLFGYGFLEEGLGILTYLKYSLVLMICCFLIQIIFYHILVVRFRVERYKHVNAVGYSAVIFGLMTIASLLDPWGSFSLLGISLPYLVMPFVSLLITQVIVPKASFIGHLSGIVAAYPLHFGLFFWYDNYIFIASLFWIFILFVWSVKKTRPNWLRFITIENVGLEDEVSIEGGRLERETGRRLIDQIVHEEV